MTAKQIQFVKENHTKYSCREIGRILNLNHQTVRYQAKKLDILFSRYFDNGNIKEFQSITKPEIAYFLGFLWADGSLIRHADKINGINLEILSSDAKEITSIIQPYIKYGTCERTRLERQPQTTISISDSLLANHLVTNWQLHKKSNHFPPLVNILSTSLIPYFMRGFFDGDGHISKGRSQRISFSAEYKYDWKNFFEVLKSLKISSWKLRYYISPKGHRFSEIRLNKEASFIFLKFIYQQKKFGLSRKYQTFLMSKDFPSQRA